jgi:hypothetical protein
MKKIIISLFVTLGVALASTPMPTINMESQINNIGQEQMDSASQKEAIAFLESKIKSNDYSSVFELGLIYEDGIFNSNGVKVPDLQTATKYYIMAFENKDYRSVFKLVPQLMAKQEYLQSLKILQEAFNNSTNSSMKISAASIYATIAIDYFQANHDILIDALINIRSIPKEHKDKTPTLRFIEANLENVVGDASKAERLLNEACLSPNAPEGLKQICFDDSNFLIVKNDEVKTIDDCNTCKLLED